MKHCTGDYCLLVLSKSGLTCSKKLKIFSTNASLLPITVLELLKAQDKHSLTILLLTSHLMECNNLIFLANN